MIYICYTLTLHLQTQTERERVKMYIHFIIPLNYLNSTGFSQHIYTHTGGYPSHMNSYEFNVWVSQNTAGSGEWCSTYGLR